MANEISLGDALKDFVQNSRHSSGLKSVQIEKVWKEKMGNTIARYTDKIQLINKTLFITTSVAPLKQELHYQKDKIISLVNEALGTGTIEEVVIH